MKQVIMFLCVVLVSCSAFAFDQSEFTGLDFIHVCEEGLPVITRQYDTSQATLSQTSSALACSTFIEGFRQSYMAQVAIVYHVDDPEQIKARAVRENLFCLPGGENTSSDEQIIRVALKYLKNNPDKLNMKAGLLVYAAFLDAFPCG